MMLWSIFQQLQQRLDQFATDRISQQQLRRLDDHLLRDIGMVRDGQRIVPLAGVAERPSQTGAAVGATVLSGSAPAAAPERLLPDVQPQAGGG